MSCLRGESFQGLGIFSAISSFHHREDVPPGGVGVMASRLSSLAGDFERDLRRKEDEFLSLTSARVKDCEDGTRLEATFEISVIVSRRDDVDCPRGLLLLAVADTGDSETAGLSGDGTFTVMLDPEAVTEGFVGELIVDDDDELIAPGRRN